MLILNNRSSATCILSLFSQFLLFSLYNFLLYYIYLSFSFSLSFSLSPTLYLCLSLYLPRSPLYSSILYLSPSSVFLSRGVPNLSSVYMRGRLYSVRKQKVFGVVHYRVDVWMGGGRMRYGWSLRISGEETDCGGGGGEVR